MPEITTTVVAKSAYGIKVKQDGPWWNFSKPEFRGERFDTTIKKGDRVWVEYNEKESGEADERVTRCWISQIEKVTAARETAQDQPFPPVDDFPLDEGGDLGDDRAFPIDATSASSEPDVVYGQEDGQFRSPKDFRRTSALAQAVAYHGPNGRQDTELDREDVILTAQRFEKYLGTGE